MERPSCFRCGQKIESYEDYVTYGGKGTLGGGIRLDGFGEFNFHVECFKKEVEEAYPKEPLVELGEGEYVFLKWLGKTWSFGRRYYKKFTASDIEKFLKELPEDVAKKLREVPKG